MHEEYRECDSARNTNMLAVKRATQMRFKRFRLDADMNSLVYVLLL